MNLNSWTAKDKARRLAMLIGSFVGSCVLSISLFDYHSNFALALFLGVVSGGVAGLVVYGMSRVLNKNSKN